MSQTINTLLLLALPASGKSELRRYLGSLTPEAAKRDLRLGRVVQLDDYPYVHMMRRISEEMTLLGKEQAFFPAPNKPFADSRDWGTLIHLLNEDYSALGSVMERPRSAAGWLFDRLDRAREEVGGDTAMGNLAEPVRERLAGIMETEAAALWENLAAVAASWEDGATVVIEFARGGPDGADMPLPEPYGYLYSLGELSDDIKEQMAALYVWVTPEESRRRNAERAKPGRDGDASILFHGVPEEVMYREYGVDDLMWLVEKSGGETIAIGGHDVPVAVFDNRDDRTSFLRADPDDWAEVEVAALHAALVTAFGVLSR